MRFFLSDGSRPLIIRDPVHNYIELTSIEKDLIDTRIFQRLRFISQTSTIFYTYPSNTSSRFEHSLGVAHLAGRFISAALQLSEERTTNDFLEAFRELCTKVSSQAGLDIEIYDHKYSLKGIVWQLTRLVALLHDIGHLPFSHVTEYAITPHYDLVLSKHVSAPLWQQYQEMLAYHEFVSLMIIQHDPEVAGAFNDRDNQPRKLFLELLKAAYKPEIKLHPALAVIHSVMSGEVDADRGDYVIRDGRNSGVEFGSYDIVRLADFMRFYRKDNLTEIWPMELALSSVETFLSERYKLHKWVIFHHHVAQTDTSIKHAIDSLLDLILAGDQEIKDIIDVTRFQYDHLLFDGTFSDDIWMWNVLREAYRSLLKRGSVDAHHIFLLRMLECCLHRRKLTPLWKTPGEYRSFSRKDFATAFRTAIFDRFEKLFQRGLLEVNEPTDEEWRYFDSHLALNLVTKHYLDYHYLSTRDLEKTINAEARDFWIILEPKKFVPIKLRSGTCDSEAKILTKEGQAPHLTDFSRTISTLTTSWDQDIHLFAFGISIDGNDVDIHIARQRFINGFIQWYGRQDLKFPSPLKKLSHKPGKRKE